MVDLSHVEHADYANYRISYDHETGVIRCAGIFRLRGDEYAAIVKLLNQAADTNPVVLTLDLRELEFLNSSGISVLSKFIIRLRDNASGMVLVKGSHGFSWQSRSLKNLQRLFPGLRLELE
jgi:hypothetical protein